ncbi:MAG: 2Fe-2S iron-sulfur cluster-binding protein, partial [Ignavibacteriaceae bacterium]
MSNKINFILNNEEVSTSAYIGMGLLDFIRRIQRLSGTKEGCREGDCGACTVLVGELINDKIEYHSVNSCLMPLGDAAGKHIVT